LEFSVIVEVPMMTTGIVFGGAEVTVVGVAPLTITALPEDAIDICCPPSDKTDPGPRV
jgi:hypothetical protein